MVWLNRLLLALLVTGAIAYLPRELSESAGSEDLARVTAERDGLAAGNESLQTDIELLEAEVRALHQDSTDPRGREALNAEIERIAREDLNLVRPGEVVFELRTEESKPK
jgi:cell division protein FtsB